MTNVSIDDAVERSRDVLPEKFLERLHKDFEAPVLDRILAGMSLAGPRGIRFNTLKADPAELLERLQADGIPSTPVPWCRHAAIVDRVHVPSILDHPCWHSGMVHVQSLPSIATSLALDPRPGERVLDLCAAPGGKTAHIAALMENSGEVIANDRSRARCHRMRALLEKLGARATVRTSDGTSTGHRQPMSYDRVLVDAPCSGEGRFTVDNPSTIEDWTVSKSRRLSSLQKSLLHSAIQAVRPGGVIIYSTCTYSKMENEAVLQRALARYGEGPMGIELEAIQLDLPGVHGPMFRSIPDPAGTPLQRAMDGFFIARLRRRER